MGEERSGRRNGGRKEGEQGRKKIEREVEVERERGKKKGKGKEGWKIVFWNVAGLGNKDKEFWKRLKEWDVMVLMETWIEEKGWNKIRRKLPEGYKWGGDAKGDKEREEGKGGRWNVNGYKEGFDRRRNGN